MNNFELITKYSSKAWDKVYRAESRSSLLDVPNDLLKFTGAKTVKIARIQTSGLSDYHRANGGVEGNFGGDGHSTGMAVGTGYGYMQGDAALIWEEFTLSMDRGVQLRIALFDDEETDGLAVAAVTTEESRVQVVPEVDAYVFSKLVEYAGTVTTQAITPSTTIGVGTSGNPIYELNAGFLALAEAEVPEEDQIIFCSNAFFNSLRNTAEAVKILKQEDFDKNIKFSVGEYEGRKIVPVPSRRFKTLFKKMNGGYGWESGSKSINFIICAKSAVCHVTKYDKVRVFSPSVVQDFDGYKVNVRIYHDLFVPMNKRPAIYASLANDATSAVSSERVLTFSYDAASDIISNVKIDPTGDLVMALYASEGDLAIGSKVADDASTNKGFVVPGVATGLTADTYYLYGVENGMIVAKAAATFVIA